ncbi:MAG TPA: glycosyltransferase family 39 protein [Thermoanaerobaculia bacterium]|nr:glycosyltransferase family 39 protein [Thermoanaerobaculia bacterium]
MRERTDRRNEAGGGEAGSWLRFTFAGAFLAGAAARLVLAFLRPIWADEIFTLTVARKPLPDLIAALRLDSGPPLHYLVSKLILMPFSVPGPADVAVRLLSVVASLLHVPLLLRIGRRCGAPSTGLVAAGLFLVFPLAAASGAEGRGYALASLLVLAAFERLLALEEAPRVKTAALAGLFGGAAVLTHYLALLPVAGMLLAAIVRGRARRLALLASGLAAVLAASWLPVALGQPRASMAWAEGQPLGERALQFAANLGLGLPVELGPARLLGPLALVVLGTSFLGRRVRARVPAAVPLLAALALLGPLLLYSRSALLPDRTALVLLPFVALVLAEARSLVPAVAGPAAAAVLAASLPGWLRPTPAAELASTLAPQVRAGARVVAADLWGPELDYRLAREGMPGRVTSYPSVVALHPGWYEESEMSKERLEAEAGAVIRGVDERTFFVFSPSTRAGRALLGELTPAGGARVAAAGPFEVWTLVPGESRGGLIGPDGLP